MWQQNEDVRFWRFVDKLCPCQEYSELGFCWEWMGSTNEGYGQFRVGNKMIAVHRFSWQLHNGHIPDNLHVLHKCDNRLCVNPSHLFLGTNQDNINDKMKKGRTYHPKRENNPRTKLDEDDVKEIRELYSTGDYTQWQLGELYGVTNSTISDIILKRHWGD